RGGKIGFGALDDMRQVEEDAAHGWICLQQRDELRAIATADVDDGFDAGEVVGGLYRGGFTAVDADHRGVEDLGFVVVLAQVVEDGLTEDFVERFLPRLN